MTREDEMERMLEKMGEAARDVPVPTDRLNEAMRAGLRRARLEHRPARRARIAALRGGAGAAAALLFLFVVRPAAGLVALVGAPQPLTERAAIAFFGIRGLGSFYYLAYALNEERFEGAEELWAVLGFTVLVSIVLHGTTVTPAMNHLDRRRRGAQGVLPLGAG